MGGQDRAASAGGETPLLLLAAVNGEVSVH